MDKKACIEETLTRLNGYLRAISDLNTENGYSHNYRVSSFSCGEDPEQAIKEHLGTDDNGEPRCLGITRVNPRESYHEINELLFRNALNRHKLANPFRESVIWRVHDELSIASYCTDGAFKPTLTDPVWKVQLKNDDRWINYCFMYKMPGYAILLWISHDKERTVPNMK